MSITNPLDLIRSDHEKVRGMFEEYEDAELEEKEALIMRIAEDLAVHMEMEEQYLYPEIEKISEEAKNRIADAKDEHDEAKSHIKQMDMKAGEDELDEHMEMLKETVLHHMEEEEDEIFMLAENNLKDDFPSLATKMMSFKAGAKGQALLQKLRPS